MKFKKFNKKLQEHFQKIIKDIDYLFEVGLDKDELWDLYLDSFPPGTNEIFRERREFDCSCCRNFIRKIGNVVRIKDGEITSIWDFETNDDKYQPVIDALSEFVKSKTVSDIYVTKLNKIGVEKNYEELENGEIKEWSHFYLELPDKLVDSSNKSEGDIKGTYRTTKEVFKRSLDEITKNSVLTVLELISQNSLYRGEQWESPLEEFLEYKREYSELKKEQKNLYAWEKSIEAGGSVGRIRNHSIGTLLVNISEGIELDLAVKKYESIVAPENYKRPKPVYTKKMLENAKEKVKELGFMESLQRRYATLEDITVNNILFSNKDTAKDLGDFDVFDEMEKDISINPKKFSRVEEVSINKFVNNVLSNTEELEVLLENRHSNNMVSLIAPEVENSKNMFKWNNNFSWAYTGNLADSSMKENVKSAGGKVDGVLRFSIQWNDDNYNPNDFDAHCHEPGFLGKVIHYADKTNPRTTGELDVDIINPERGTPAVENITWTNKNKMQEGRYKFLVHNYSHNGGRDGFKAEIEFDGQIYNFEYNKELKQKEKIHVADVVFDKQNGFSIEEKLPSDMSTREIWGLNTNQFHPVSVAMFSPNYWDEQGVGNKHYFFMLKNCVNPEEPNGFYNEFLKENLRPHRKVFEALGSKMAVKESDNQLSGVGFSSTKKNDLLIKAKGRTERILKIKI